VKFVPVNTLRAHANPLELQLENLFHLDLMPFDYQMLSKSQSIRVSLTDSPTSLARNRRAIMPMPILTLATFLFILCGQLVTGRPVGYLLTEKTREPM
jgi:hypothetical protein